MTQSEIEAKALIHHQKIPMGSLYKELLAYGKGLPAHRHQPGSGYDFVFASTLRGHDFRKRRLCSMPDGIPIRTDFENIDEEYRILGKKGEGTFSEVLKCQHIKDGTYYACKKMKQHYNGVDEVNNLREIQAMRRLNPHANVIELHEIIFDKKTGTVALICELMDMNIYELIRGRRHYLQESKVKTYMYQLLKSLDHMHRCGIFHRDVKPENILIREDVLKLADFGSCRSVYSKQPYTEYISTRWYRAPECLLTDGYYTYRMDLWSVGCVFFEVMSLHPLFPGANEVDQIAKIHEVLGTPDASILNKMKHRNRGINFDFPPKKGTGVEKLLPHASQHCIELIYKMCTYDPDERITAKQALRHSYFRDLREVDKRTHDAKQAARFNEVAANKPTQTSNTSDVPLWKQNQIQKKRSADGRKSTANEFVASGRKINKKNSREIVKIPSKQELALISEEKPAKKSKSKTSKTSILSLRITPKETGKDFSKDTEGKVTLVGISESPIVVQPILGSDCGVKRAIKNNTSYVQPNLSRVLKPAVLKGGGKQQFPGAICRPSMSDKIHIRKPPTVNSTVASKKERESAQPKQVEKESPLKRNFNDNKRRQRRLVEQHQAHGQTIGGHGVIGALPQIVPVNGTAIHGFSTTSSKPPFPSTTLPKVPLHHSHQQGPSLLPGILKPNLLSTKHLPKHKMKPTDVSTKSMYSHYQLPSINRHVYH